MNIISIFAQFMYLKMSNKVIYSNDFIFQSIRRKCSIRIKRVTFIVFLLLFLLLLFEFLTIKKNK